VSADDATNESYHVPVMLRETIDALVVDPSGSYVDGTLGGGGHTREILSRIREGGGTLYAFDADPGAIANATERFPGDLGKRLIVRQSYFSQAIEWLEEGGIQLSGVMLDLGVSSRQLDTDQIGLSYRQEMPLDMRFDPAAAKISAREIVNRQSAEEIATLLRTYGEEPAAWKIAQAITRGRSGRPIGTTKDLREIIEGVIPAPLLMKTHSRVFPALRIAVNDELGELRLALDRFTGLLKPGGRFVVLTYHSLEDRIVKDAFREEERSCICPPEFPVCRCDKEQRLKVLTRKPMLPSEEEIERNPRARSAKLRVAERVVDTRRKMGRY
jgi:16S rRNA (cytosine1402-N4)-methyltransferase